MSKEEALARLYVAIESRVYKFDRETIRRENSALQDAFEVLGVSSAGFWQAIGGIRNDDRY